ncbi:unnamed protein product [Schistosoma curassoni]|uniref:Myotubularin phosphatase domain-containing protein n=1 Tax=Schistosoma curassoni TaxID=6186 RepID=A0A183KY80_9TREM|nr:unnamed protein product [Schistosoma curassoni]
MDSLTSDSQLEPTKVVCDKSSIPFNSTAYWTGLFNTIRYLSIGWDQFSNKFMKNISFLNLNIPQTSSVHLDSYNTLHSRLVGMLNPDDSIPFSSEDKIDSPKKLLKTDYTYFDNRMWSKAFFMCLHYACDLSTSNSLMVQTASLEAFVQLLVVRRPLFLFPISWLTSITSCSSPVPLSSNQHLNDNTSNNDILNDKTIIESSSQQYKLYESTIDSTKECGTGFKPVRTMYRDSV